MKLIELLVQELPKRGGWPDGRHVASACYDKKVAFHALGYPPFVMEGLTFSGLGSVTLDQYEAALAASKPEWDGEGLPPVGCKCEFMVNGDTSWKIGAICTVDYITPFSVVVDRLNNVYPISELRFRPIRSEADKKKEAVEKSIADALFKDGDFDFSEALRLSTFVYGAISRNEIPHIRID